MQIPIKVGITGGIGSGKSIVSKVFQQLEIPIFDADSEAKRLMNENIEIREKLIAAFGQNVYNAVGLNREYLSKIVFNNAEKLNTLNAIVHPITIQASKDWMHRQQSPYVVKEAALFFESGTAGDLDYIIGVYAPKNIRLQRAMGRDNAHADAILKRMDKQINEVIKMRLCDFVVVNDDSKLVLPQVLEIHRFLIEKSKSM